MKILILFIVIQVIHFAGTWKLYRLAGRKAWEAVIPVYNAYVLTKIIRRPWWWVILLFIPVINLLMFPAFWVETLRSFGKEKTSDVILAVLTLGFYIMILNYNKDTVYLKERQLKPHTKAGEWVTSIVFAVIAATIVHNYIMRPYTIPTPSLEKSLLVGDYLFVSKFHYGARIPMTLLSLPMVHDTMPFPTKFKSYSTALELPYMRLPGLQKIKRNEIVVFNWPADTVRFFRDRSGIHVDKPVDKRSNYVKRCVGIPGDDLEIKDAHIYINGQPTLMPDRTKIQRFYTVTFKEYPSLSYLRRIGLSKEFKFRFYQTDIPTFTQLMTNPAFGRIIKQKIPHDSLMEFESYYTFKPNEVKRLKLKPQNKVTMNLTDKLVEELKNNKGIASVELQSTPKGTYNPAIFPHSPDYPWSTENYGPVHIPAKGETVALNMKNLPLYKRIIDVYENNDLEVEGDQILINGKLADSYTFKQDYYWMMGDNRNNSEDARFWGFVPFDHVVGKPVFIWWSVEQSDKPLMQRIRWDRVFTTVHGEGERVSYLIPFVILVILWQVLSFVIKRRKSAS